MQEIIKTIMQALETPLSGFKDKFNIYAICCVKPAVEEAVKHHISAEEFIAQLQPAAVKWGCPSAVYEQGIQATICYFYCFGITKFKEWMMLCVELAKEAQKST